MFLASLTNALKTRGTAIGGQLKAVAHTQQHGILKRKASHVSPFVGALLPLQTLNTPRMHASRMSNLSSYEEKYHDKLVKKARDEGYSTIEEMKEAKIAQVHKERKEKIEIEKQHDHDKPSNKTTNSSSNVNSATMQQQTASGRVLDRASDQSSSNLPSNVKPLGDIVKLDLLEDKSRAEISEIWTKYHAGKDMLCATIPAETYRDLLKEARANPVFVIPLPREQGIEFFFLQFDYHQVHFTSLIEYKVNGTNARPYLTLTHYTDLIGTKGIVLMRGEIDNESANIDIQNAQYLALQLQQFYVTGGPEKRRLVEVFNHRPEEFKYQAVIDAAEKI